MNHQELQISPFQCQLCFNHTNGQLRKLELIEQVLQICFDCQVYVTNVIANIKLNIKKINTFYSRQIEFRIDSNKIIYQLKQSQCQICYFNSICTKIPSCQHFFCFRCFQSYISNQRNFVIKCPQQDCDLFIDDYFVFLFMSIPQSKQWVEEKYYFFCPNKNCKTILQLIPFQYTERKIFQISINLSQCSLCQIIICTNCWKELKGINIQHQKTCKKDKQLILLLQKPDIFQCPKCKIYSAQDCKMRNQKIQECPACRANFCLFCKTANIQLFNKEKPLKYACDCWSNFINKNIIKIVLYSIFQILYFLIIGFIALLGQGLTILIENIVINYCNSRCIQYLNYIFFPITIIFKILREFCKFVVHRENTLFSFILKLLGINEEIYFIMNYDN